MVVRYESLHRQSGLAGQITWDVERYYRALGLAPATLSFHLKELNHAGMIAATAKGRHIVYAASFEQMNALLAYLTENCCQGNPGACRPTGLAAGRATKKPIAKPRKTA